MRLAIRNTEGNVEGVWVAKTSRGFNKQQRRDIRATQLRLRKCVTPDCTNTGEVFAGGLQGGLCSECMKAPHERQEVTR